MKTLIFCTSYINNDKNNSNNIERYKRWVNYYKGKMEYFNTCHLFLIDDGSPNTDIDHEIDILDPENLPVNLSQKINLIHFKNNLGRPTWNDYQGWWRSFSFSIKVAQKYSFDKILHIESDFYIVSHRMADYMKSVSSGWVAPLCRSHNFPETAIQIICKDSFPKFEKFYEEAMKCNFSFDQIAELYLPFTKVEEGFYGDRLGEHEILQEWLEFIDTPFELDYFGQLHPKYSLEDYSSIFKFDLL